MMATPHSYIAIRVIQWRRRVARRRMLKDMGWKTGWSK